jgi:hypothetical protein
MQHGKVAAQVDELDAEALLDGIQLEMASNDQSGCISTVLLIIVVLPPKE